MCGRLTLTHPNTALAALFDASLANDLPDSPRFNICPTQAVPVVTASSGRRLLAPMRWGLVPAWAREAGKSAPMNNARAETVTGKPTFREAYRRRRCLVPMNGFYEWHRAGAQKTPYYIRMQDDELFAVAGLYEYRPGDTTVAPMMTFTVLTTAANALMQPIHDRMPVILPPEAYEEWLDPRNTSARGLETLLQPYPVAAMQVHPVSPRVNSVRNDDAALMEAAAASAILGATPLQGQLL